MDEITGILAVKIARAGTKSEGPDYYIKPLDDYANRWSEILVWKKTKQDSNYKKNFSNQFHKLKKIKA